MRPRKWFSLDSIYIFMKKMGPYYNSACPTLKRTLYKKPPLEICFLSTIWVPIEVKMKMSLEKVTQVISQSGVWAGLSKLHIDWINSNKVWFYFYYMNCSVGLISSVVQFQNGGQRSYDWMVLVRACQHGWLISLTSHHYNHTILWNWLLRVLR